MCPAGGDALTCAGQGEPRRGGDFEAQRHWMELAVHTSPREWYVDTPKNDLAWWGLDYPPLSGYWAWAVGKVYGRPWRASG